MLPWAWPVGLAESHLCKPTRRRDQSQLVPGARVDSVRGVIDVRAPPHIVGNIGKTLRSALAMLGLLVVGWLAGLVATTHARADTPPPMLMLESGVHSAPVRRIDIDEARQLAVTVSDDRTARIWNLRDGQPLHVLRPFAFGAEGGRLYGVAIHPTRPLVAVGGTTGGGEHAHQIYLFDLDSGALLRSFDARAADVRKLTWSIDGAVLWAGYATGNAVRAFDAEGRERLNDEMGGAVFGLSTGADGRTAAVSLSGQLRFYGNNASTIEKLRAVDLGGRRAAGVSFSPEGKRVAIAFADVADRRASRYVEVFDVQSGHSLQRFADADAQGGDLRVVAWSRDGRTVYAAGTAYAADNRFPVMAYDAASGRVVRTTAVADNSITDLVAMRDGGVAFASFDGSWGTIAADNTVKRYGSAATAPLDPQDLEVDADATAVRWGRASGFFAFEGRRTQAPSATRTTWHAPQTAFGMFDRPTDWNLAGTQPMVGGKRLPLAADERSRALVVAAATRTVFIGTNRALYGVNDKGDVRWRQAVDTEIRAVNASQDGRMIVTAMADGTLRWWRASDGDLLLTVFVDRNGRWLVWSPSGYFDAGVGADGMAGWAVGSGPGKTMDFYSLNRFRDRFARPDLIDAVLKELDLTAAVQRLSQQAVAARDAAAHEAAAREASARDATLLAQQEQTLAREAEQRRAQEGVALERARQERRATEEVARRQQAEQEAARVQAEHEARRQAAMQREQEARAEAQRAAQEARALAEAAQAKKALEVVKALEVPPVVATTSNRELRASRGEAELVFTIRNPDARGGDVKVEVRLDGRPFEPLELTLPASMDGSAKGKVRLRASQPRSVIEIIAHNRHGPSEPLRYTIEDLASQAASQAASQGAGGTTSDAAKGDLVVLAIGISNYRRSEYRLNLAAKDARDFAAALQQQQGRLYRRVIVKVLADQDATRAAVLREFDWLKATVGPSDVAMLFMAGHGLNDSGGQYHFLPHDGAHERLASTGVGQATIVSTLARIRGKTLFFVDTCYAGNTLGAFSRGGRQSERLMNDLASSENGVVVFASSTGQEESEEKLGWGNGAFTRAVIDGLAGRADFTRAGRVTSAGLNLYVSEEVSRLTEGRQRPVFISPRGIPDFSLARL